ncbi:MAG: extracellular solute-binding protein [Treponema sp.]|jgi:putative aldouronate transport system substrate-binding protein|nr:extracellular solute-binding protein [Treponema sp.]
MKKLLTFLCMASIGLSLFAGGGRQSGGGSAASGGGTVPQGYAVPVSQGGELTDTFTIFLGAVVMSPDDTVMQRYLKEKTGIDFRIRGIQSDDVQTSVNLMLASGEALADMLILGRDMVIRNALIDSGKVMELSPLYNSATLKTIPNIPQKIKDFVTESDGKMYVFPGNYDQNPDDPFPGWALNAFWIRTDLMEQAGVTEQDISTLAGFEGALRKFRTLRNPAGTPMIPLSFIQGGQQEKTVLAMFGVDMANGVSGMPPVMNIGGRPVFAFENPDYLEAYKWLNRMYNEGLIDMEVTTQSSERFQEKLESGQFVAYVGEGGQGLWDYWKEMWGPEDNPAKWYMYPFQSPRVPNKTKQAVSYVSPYPSHDIFINKDTRRLNAIMHYLEWAQEPIYYRQHEVSEGPEGTTWWFTDAERRQWQFEPEYERDRNSGDAARAARVTPGLWQANTSSKEWYPWFTQAAGSAAPGNYLTPQYSQYIGNEIVNHRAINAMDMVQAPLGGVIVDNLPTLNQVRDEYTAKMIMAANTAACEAVYREFLQMLEARANWSGMKAEWERLYNSAR